MCIIKCKLWSSIFYTVLSYFNIVPCTPAIILVWLIPAFVACNNVHVFGTFINFYNIFVLVRFICVETTTSACLIANRACIFNHLFMLCIVFLFFFYCVLVQIIILNNINCIIVYMYVLIEFFLIFA